MTGATTATQSVTPQGDPAEAVAARLPVTDARSWLILLGIALLLIAGAVWAFFGQAPQTVKGQGIIVPAHGFVDAGRDANGFLSELLVAPGDHVMKGQIIARLETDGVLSDVPAPATGTIATILERTGGYSDPGLPLMTIDPDRDADVAVAFVPALTGSQVRAGMAARVGLATYPSSQYGTITGTVKSIAVLPATPERIALLVGGNASLADYFAAGGPVLEVTVQLDPDPASPSGYHWTFGTGPQTSLTTGTLADVNVVIADGSPIERILR